MNAGVWQLSADGLTIAGPDGGCIQLPWKASDFRVLARKNERLVYAIDQDQRRSSLDDGFEIVAVYWGDREIVTMQGDIDRCQCYCVGDRLFRVVPRNTWNNLTNPPQPHYGDVIEFVDDGRMITVGHLKHGDVPVGLEMSDGVLFYRTQEGLKAVLHP